MPDSKRTNSSEVKDETDAMNEAGNENNEARNEDGAGDDNRLPSEEAATTERTTAASVNDGEEDDTKPPAIDFSNVEELVGTSGRASSGTGDANTAVEESRVMTPTTDAANTTESTADLNSNATTEPSSTALSLPTNSTVAATPARNGRAQRLARKQEQLNSQSHSPGAQTPVTGSPNSNTDATTMVRSRLPPITTPALTPTRGATSSAPGDNVARSPVASLPGDNLVGPSAATIITSRARQPAEAPPRPTVTPRGPLPSGPRLTKAGAHPPSPTGGAHTTNTDATTSSNNGTLSEEAHPGAYQERNRAIGDIPVWARERGANAQRTNGTPGASTTTTNNATGAASVVPNVGEESAPELDVENSAGLASAEPVADAETVVYAEDVKEDEIVRARRRLLIIAAVAIVVIVALVITLVFVLFLNGGDDECKLPMEEITISTYCRCQGTADGYLKHFHKKDPGLFDRYEHLRGWLEAKPWLKEDSDLSEASCEEENMVLSSMALLGTQVAVEEFNTTFDVLGELLSEQQFALHSLFFSMNGDKWTQKAKWLEDPYVCNWEGVQCDFPSRVSEIQLANNNLSGSLPSYIGLAPSLKKIDLSFNNIYGEIPSDLMGLAHIQMIDFSNLQLNGTIPSELALMTSLHTLELGNNSLTGTIPSEMGTMNLLTLRLDLNQLEGTLPALGQGEYKNRLRFLNVRHNKLQGTIPREIQALPRLEYVDLSYNSFKGKPPDFISASASRGIEIVNLIHSGLSGYLPDPYCELKSNVIVLAVCQRTSGIRDCLCCAHTNSSQVLQCKSELSEHVLAYVTGPIPESPDD